MLAIIDCVVVYRSASCLKSLVSICTLNIERMAYFDVYNVTKDCPKWPDGGATAIKSTKSLITPAGNFLVILVYLDWLVQVCLIRVGALWS